jgi:putative SOS response-associated peptidase YedK
MCGRFTLHSRERIKIKGLANPDLPFEPRYNIAPSQTIAAIADFGRGPELRWLVWGLVPSWSIDGKGFINARAETLEDKPSFSDSFRVRRCLIPADGFYEWKRSGRSKRPFYFQMEDESPFAFAGIWDRWKNRPQSIVSCAIITTHPNELVEELHDRMPAILLPEFYEAWLDLNTDRAKLQQLLTPVPASKMKVYPVSSAVNSPDNEGVNLVEQVEFESGATPSLF